MKKIFLIFQVFLLIYAVLFMIGIDFSKTNNIFGIEQVISIVILLLFHFFRTLRLRKIVKIYIQEFSIIDALFLYYIGLAFAIVTPGRVGEVYRIKLLHEKKISYQKAWEIFILEKYTDLIALSTFLLFSVVSILFKDLNSFFILLSIILISIFGIYLIFFFSKKFSERSNFFKKKNIAIKIIEFFSRFFAIHCIDIVKIYIETFLGWILFLLALWVGISSVYILSLYELINVHILNSAAVSLPISYMGYGLREFFLNSFMFNNSSEMFYIAVITIQFTIFYFFSVLIGLFMYFYKILKKRI